MPSAIVVFLYLHGYAGKWEGSCCLQYRIPEWLKKQLNFYSKVLSERPKETSWLLLSLTLKCHFADTSPSGVHTQHNLTYGLFPPRSEMKNEWEMSHFHNRALRPRCRGKSKNFCQFMEIKTQNWGRHAWQALPGLGAGSFLSQHVSWEAFGEWALERVWALPVGICKGYPWGHCFPHVQSAQDRAVLWGDWRMFCCRYGNYSWSPF